MRSVVPVLAGACRGRAFSASLRAIVSDPSEPDEIARAVAGDRNAQARLVDRHMPGVYALARRMLGSDEEAEDVTQDTFLRAWKALPAWQPRARLSTWLYRVALNRCYDRLRKRRERALEGLPEPVDPGPRAERRPRCDEVES